MTNDRERLFVQLLKEASASTQELLEAIKSQQMNSVLRASENALYDRKQLVEFMRLWFGVGDNGWLVTDESLEYGKRIYNACGQF